MPALSFSSESMIAVSPHSHQRQTLHNNRQPDNSIAWTIWTVNEPANYIIAACLPTLRPLFLRILPSSLFVLSKQRGSKPQSSGQKALQTPESPAPDSSLQNEASQPMGRSRLNNHPSHCNECWVDMEASRPRNDVSRLKVVTTVSELEIERYPTR